MGSETISAVMSALAVILGMIGAMFSVKHTASSIEKTSDGDAKEAKEAAQKVQEGNKDIISLMLNNMSELLLHLFYYSALWGSNRAAVHCTASDSPLGCRLARGS